MNIRQRSLLTPAALATAAMLPLLSGCAGISNVAPSAPVVQAIHMTGSIHGGQQPISGARIYLYSVGTYTNAPSTSLLTGTGVTNDGNGNGYVSSDAGGNFDVTGDYTCPADTTGISTYVLALGGNPGLAAGTSNSAIALIAALGPCSGLMASTFVNVNEVSTVAAVTALQQFMTDSTDVADGTVAAQPSYGMPSGIPNAMLTIPSLVDLASGIALAAPSSGGVSPRATVNTLANILASCINTASPSSTECAALFTAATPAGGTAPTDTVAAMLNIAKNPGSNVVALFGRSTAAAPFQPTLAAAPNDFSLGISYTAGISFPNALAIDNSGNVFVANCPTCNGGTGTDSIQGFTPAGVVKSGIAFTTNVHKPASIVLDRYNSIWVTEVGDATIANQVTRLSNDGTTVQGGFPVQLNGNPGGIAIVENGPAAAWITDTENGRMVLINANGSAMGGINTTGLTNPTAIAADGLENLYVIGTGSTSILQYAPIYDRTQQGGTLSPTASITLANTFSGASAGFSSPASLAIDGGDHIWTLDTGATKAVSEIFGVTGAASSPAAGYSGVNVAKNISIDGAGTAWIANCRASCAGSGSTAADNVVHLSATGTSLTTSDGLQNSQLATPTASAIDSSGNLWITNTSGANVTELVGVAVPVILELQTASSRHALPAVNYLRNPSFDLGGMGNPPPAWTVTSTVTGSAKEDNGSPFSGQQKLTYYNSTPYVTTTSQTVTVPNGNYLATCYIASGPGATARVTQLIASGYDAAGSTLTNAPTDLSYTFQPYSLIVPVTNGSLTLGLYNNEPSANGYTGWDSCSVTRQ